RWTNEPGDPEATPGIWPGPFFSVASGTSHACGLQTDGGVMCWGENDQGQSDDQDGPFSMVSAGGTHTCALQTNGDIFCWGDNGQGQVGDDAEANNFGVDPGFTSVTAGPFVDVAAGAYHSCGMKADGSVTCWGYNDDTQLDVPGTLPEEDPVVFTDIAAGDRHNCGIVDDGSILCWGSNSFSKVDGHTNIGGGATPYIGPFADLSIGSEHSCGLMEDKSILCWGKDTSGESSPPKVE
ncbi:MAG: hypothetical protein VX938_06250, partial [Myxococcota bacterium]|nr:hypothetical protein [Myxococcota bacterium]